MKQIISGGYTADARVRWTEYLPWVVAIAAFFLMPDYVALGTRILIFILFALSLDLALGYAGIITLGHSAFFGLGAYVAGCLSVRAGVVDPFLQLAGAAAAAALLGALTGAIILRTRAFTLLMLTMAITSILFEIANKWTSMTGGADGLAGIVVAPLLGRFEFDLFSKTAYWYCLSVLLLGWWLMRRLVYSPFGAVLAGLRENPTRMHAIGTPVYSMLVGVYTISAAMAGVAGALLTQTNQTVGLNVLGYELSGELLVMLILGGIGRIYGAFTGTVVYIIAQDYFAKQFPEYWYFGIGLILVIVVMFAPGGISGMLDNLRVAVRKPG